MLNSQSFAIATSWVISHVERASSDATRLVRDRHLRMPILRIDIYSDLLAAQNLSQSPPFHHKDHRQAEHRYQNDGYPHRCTRPAHHIIAH